MKRRALALHGLRFIGLLVSMAGISLAEAVSKPKAPLAPAGAAIRQKFFSGAWAKAELPETAVPEAPVFRAAHDYGPHLSLTQQAYRLYAARYEGGELALYLGGASGEAPASDTPDNVSAGAYDEDMPDMNPWDDRIPELRHFWDCRASPTRGLAGYDSAVNRAQKYFTGGYGLDGKYDYGWGVKGTQGRGILALYEAGDKPRAYWYLGHAAHLLQDLTVPAHALLWPHPVSGSDAYERYAERVYREREALAPAPIESFASLYDLYYRTADAAGDYDAGFGPGSLRGVDGRRDRGARRARGFTEEELRQEADALLPLAARRVAALYLHFFRQVDRTPPRVVIAVRRSEDGSRVALTAAASDAQSGVDRTSYRFEYALRTRTGWSTWRKAPGKIGGQTLDFTVEPGRAYRLRAGAADAVGNRGFSPVWELIGGLAVAAR